MRGLAILIAAPLYAWPAVADQTAIPNYRSAPGPNRAVNNGGILTCVY